MKKVYIVLLNYNGFRDTIECVNSIKKSIQRNDYDIIVVDNKSTDNSIIKIEKELKNDIILIKSDFNNGFSAGNNIGIQYAIEHGADYVMLLNNDTIIEEDILTPMINFSDTNKKCGCVSCRICYNNKRNKIWYDGGTFNALICRAKHYRFNQEGSIIKGINNAAFVTGCCMLIPTKVINKIGLMDERYFLYVEDTEYCLRMIKHGYKLYWDADHKIYHKVSASTNKISKLSQFYEIRNRLLLRDTYLNFIQKTTTMLYNLVFYTYKVITKKYSLQIIIKAIKYNRKKEYGRIENI